MQNEYIADFLYRGSRGKWMHGGERMDPNVVRQLRDALSKVLGRTIQHSSDDQLKNAIDVANKGTGLIEEQAKKTTALLKYKQVLNKNYHALNAAFKKYNQLKDDQNKISGPEIDTIKALLEEYKKPVGEETEDTLIARISALNKKIITDAPDIVASTIESYTKNVNDTVKNIMDYKSSAISPESMEEKIKAVITSLETLTNTLKDKEGLNLDLKQFGKQLSASKEARKMNAFTDDQKNQVIRILNALCDISENQCDDKIKENITAVTENFKTFKREKGADEKLLTSEASYKTPRLIIYKLAEFKRGLSGTLNINVRFNTKSKQHLRNILNNDIKADFIDTVLDMLTSLDKSLPINDAIKSHKITTSA
jgi:uncharacterized coiled-coil DUF342 family protein